MESSSNQLLDRMKATKDKTEHTKFRAMHLYKVEKMSAGEVAKMVGTTIGNIYQWAYKYKKFGIDGLSNKSRGGRRWSYMSLEEEKALLEQLTPEANKGLVIISKVVRSAAEEKLGKPVSADYAEDLLNRHNWRKVSPRSKHPKSSKDEQEEFKKKSQKLSKKQRVHLTYKIIDL
jgi:transposase